MPVSSLVLLAANITRAHGELWPLSAAAVWSTSLQGALDVATRTAPTVADALNIGARFGSTRAPFIRNRLRRTARSIQIEIAPAVPGPGWTRTSAPAPGGGRHNRIEQVPLEVHRERFGRAVAFVVIGTAQAVAIDAADAVPAGEPAKTLLRGPATTLTAVEGMGDLVQQRPQCRVVRRIRCRGIQQPRGLARENASSSSSAYSNCS